MVGVPGRSEGCKTCRRRKKGCDLQRPACGNCIRARLTCEGYARQWTFVANGPVVKGDYTAVVAKRHPPQSTPLRFLPHGLSRTAFETQSLSLFWDLYFPANERTVPSSRKVGINFSNWTLAVRRLDLNDSALRPALLALCLARIGESNNDRPVREQSIKLYGTALKEMNLALQDEARVQTDELLAAGKLMAGYEMFHGSTTPELAARGVNWRNHTDGVIKLLEIRGQRQNTTQDAHILFLDTRLSAILAAIISRKPNFFATPLWQTLPFDGAEKDLSDALFDIMATLPFLLREFDQLRMYHNPVEVHPRGIQLWYRCRAVDRALRQWYASLSSKVPQPLPSAIRPAANRADSPDRNDDLFCFEESDYALAITLALYWATCNLLHSLILAAYAYFRSSGLAEYAQELPDHIDPHITAVNIAQSVGYFIRPEMGILGPQLISFPMGVALMYFMASNDPNADEERQRLLASIGRLSEGMFIDRRSIGHAAGFIVTVPSQTVTGVFPLGSDVSAGRRKKSQRKLTTLNSGFA
ncbi:MAG: hypothetical protein Q9193_004830 [Seirophora villosa]